ncbi:MAG TPA: HAD family phosphatase [Terriglobia bacterium]|nr:HAD family phosphatase [Terriglobia bacterium]
MLRAIIFDFDGIIVDSEPIIMKLTHEMAAQEGWAVSEEDYYRDYLALDDRGIVEHLFISHGRPVDHAHVEELVNWKSRVYGNIIEDGLPTLPGAVDFVRQAANAYPLAIASGSARSEIDHLLGKLRLRDLFGVIASADDCARSKPDPEVYLRALAGMNTLPEFQKSPLLASECLAIEDAPGGIDAAHAAGIRCMGLAHSRATEHLKGADWAFSGFPEVDLDAIAKEFNG